MFFSTFHSLLMAMESGLKENFCCLPLPCKLITNSLFFVSTTGKQSFKSIEQNQDKPKTSFQKANRNCELFLCKFLSSLVDIIFFDPVWKSVQINYSWNWKQGFGPFCGLTSFWTLGSFHPTYMRGFDSCH